MPLPPTFRDYISRRLRPECVERLCEGLTGEPSVSIRINRARFTPTSLPEGCSGRVPWCPDGYYLSSRPAFTADPLLHAGAYYVQEASSQFAHHAVAHALQACNLTPKLALDLCAAPGGKSTLLRALLPDSCLLLSNEPLQPRAQVLAENMAKWGHSEVIVTNAYADEIAAAVESSRRDDALFDLILADVPCSGEGMFRKEAEAVAAWSEGAVAQCAERQRAIISDIWPTLRTRGLLVYSTCTFNPEEDEDNVLWICQHLGAHLVPIPVAESWHVDGHLLQPTDPTACSLQEYLLHAPQKVGAPTLQTTCTYLSNSLHLHCELPAGCFSTPCNGSQENLHAVQLTTCHLLPGTVQGEGFFIAVLRKDDDSPVLQLPAARTSRKSKGRTDLPLRAILEAALPTLPTDMLDRATLQPKKHQPAATVAPPYPKVDVPLADAFAYLQHQAIVLPAAAPRGIVSLCYQGQRLGLCNNLGSRANNLYPQAWRIRSSHLTPHTIWPQHPTS